MKYSIKPKNDSDKENEKQLELIINNKLAQYDNISEVIKEQVDNFELKRPCIIDGHEELISKTESEIISFDQSFNDFIIEQRGIHIQSINPMGIHAVMPAVIGGLNHNIMIIDDIELAKKMKEPELIQFDCWKEEKKPKDNHPYGWYRKFDKKRF